MRSGMHVGGKELPGSGDEVTLVDPATGEIAPDRLTMILALDSYAEYSPTRTGVKVFLKGTLPGERRKNPALRIEMYDSDRFFTVTGHQL